MKAFKAYDIRGVYGVDFDRDAVYRIGYHLPRLFGAKTIAVGRDARISSPEIAQTLLQGIADSGTDVDFYDLSTTPFVYWITARQGYDTSVMITASHNPKNHNGLKISAKDAAPVGYDTGLNKLEQWVENETPVPVANKGTVHDCSTSLKKEYVEFQRQYVGNLDGLKMVVDCSNGMANLFVKQLLPDNVIYIADNIDGTFPCHEPNPLEPANIVALQQKVRETHADIGVIYDGDADRVMFVDENAKFVSPDLMIGLLATHFLKNDGSRPKVLQDIRTSKAVAELIDELGGEPCIWRVGRAYAAKKLHDIDGLFGGELAGHYYFRDFYYSDSGIMASLLILSIIAERHRNGQDSTLQKLRRDKLYHRQKGRSNGGGEKPFLQCRKPHTFSRFRRLPRGIPALVVQHTPLKHIALPASDTRSRHRRTFGPKNRRNKTTPQSVYL